MKDYRVVYIDMDTSIKGYVLRTADGFNTIVLNPRHAACQCEKTFLHEMEHIESDDFDCCGTADEIEAKRHCS